MFPKCTLTSGTVKVSENIYYNELANITSDTTEPITSYFNQ